MKEKEAEVSNFIYSPALVDSGHTDTNVWEYYYLPRLDCRERVSVVKFGRKLNACRQVKIKHYICVTIKKGNILPFKFYTYILKLFSQDL